MQQMQFTTRLAVLISVQGNRCQWLSWQAQESKRPKLGRPARTEAFLEVARYLEENDDEQITIDDLIDLMGQKLENTANVAYMAVPT